MYKLFAISVLMFTVLANADTIRLSEPIEVDGEYETFGSSFESSLQPVSLAQLLAAPLHYSQTPFILDTKVAKVCQKKGCFFIAQEEELTIRVSFKDYGFFMPTDSSNKIVSLTGVLTKREMTQKQAQHYKADLGEEQEPGSLQTGFVWEIVASSIKVPLA